MQVPGCLPCNACAGQQCRGGTEQQKWQLMVFCGLHDASTEQEAQQFHPMFQFRPPSHLSSAADVAATPPQPVSGRQPTLLPLPAVPAPLHPQAQHEETERAAAEVAQAQAELAAVRKRQLDQTTAGGHGVGHLVVATTLYWIRALPDRSVGSQTRLIGQHSTKDTTG